MRGVIIFMTCDFFLYRQCPSNSYQYAIRQGDTLYLIASRFGVGVSQLIAANPGLDPYRLRIGQVICIPICPPGQSARVIQPRDTLYGIAQTYHVSVDAIIRANPGIDPNYLAIGQRICIPFGCPSGYTAYTIRSGDTLSAIAGRYNTTLQRLLAANPQITNPNIMTIGQKLCVPVVDKAAELLAGMTLDEKIGQMIIGGFEGYEVNDNVRSLIRNYHIGGLILYGRNVQSTDQLLALINWLKITNSVNKVPIFISVDEEGGRVSRMPAEFVNIPGMGAIGEINDSGLAYRVGNVIAEMIRSFGFNMDFAPVLDINSNPNNPVIGDRALGSTAEIVSRLGVQTMLGIRDGGVIPVVKHFPGHGDTSVDSHTALPVVYYSLNRLEGFEFVPFASAINYGTDAVMVAHILLTQVDPANPSSMSRAVITDILRNRLGFKGVVITDDMTMGAITNNYDLADAAVRSVNAGSDIILLSGGYNNEVRVLNALKKAAANGTIPMSRINESVYRILKLKQKYNLRDTTISRINVSTINSDIEAVLRPYGL